MPPEKIYIWNKDGQTFRQWEKERPRPGLASDTEYIRADLVESVGHAWESFVSNLPNSVGDSLSINGQLDKMYDALKELGYE